MKGLLRILAAVAVGFLLMLVLSAVFTQMGWPVFNGRGLAHGSFLVAWPVLSAVGYRVVGRLRYFRPESVRRW